MNDWQDAYIAIQGGIVIALKSKKEAAPLTERADSQQRSFKLLKKSHRKPRQPCSHPHSKLRIPAQTSSYKLIELTREGGQWVTDMDAQHSYISLLLTENDESDE
jgi:hypothetical protein